MELNLTVCSKGMALLHSLPPCLTNLLGAKQTKPLYFPLRKI